MTDHTITRGQAGRLRERLSDRDLAVLASLYQFRLATPQQLQRLHIPDGSPRTRARRMRGVLQRLSDRGVIVRLARRIGGMQPGSSAHVIGLSGLGLAVLNVQGPYGRKRRRVWETTPHFVRHVLGVTELAVGLTELTRAGSAKLATFDGEPACWRRFPGSGGELVTLKPDAFVRLETGGYEVSAFLELDHATESRPAIARKLEVYARYWRSGEEVHRYGVFPKTWFIVPDAARAEVIAGAIRRLPDEAHELFNVCLQQEATDLLTEVPTEGGAR